MYPGEPPATVPWTLNLCYFIGVVYPFHLHSGEMGSPADSDMVSLHLYPHSVSSIVLTKRYLLNERMNGFNACNTRITNEGPPF